MVMSRQGARRIVQERMSEPHIEGRRIPVLTLRTHVEERGEDPRAVAAQFDLEVADVYRALTYYHEHPDEMQEARKKRAESRERVRQEAEKHRPDGVSPPNDDG